LRRCAFHTCFATRTLTVDMHLCADVTTPMAMEVGFIGFHTAAGAGMYLVSFRGRFVQKKLGRLPIRPREGFTLRRRWSHTSFATRTLTVGTDVATPTAVEMACIGFDIAAAGGGGVPLVRSEVDENSCRFEG